MQSAINSKLKAYRSFRIQPPALVESSFEAAASACHDGDEFDVSKFGGKIEEWAAWEAPGFAQFELASLRANLFFQSAVVVLQRCHSLCLRTSVM